MNKVNEFYYKVPTAGLGGEMFIAGMHGQCGDIHNGVSIHLSVMRGGWVISLSSVWKIAFIASAEVVKQMALSAWFTVSKRWQRTPSN